MREKETGDRRANDDESWKEEDRGQEVARKYKAARNRQYLRRVTGVTRVCDDMRAPIVQRDN